MDLIFDTEDNEEKKNSCGHAHKRGKSAISEAMGIIEELGVEVQHFSQQRKKMIEDVKALRDTLDKIVEIWENEDLNGVKVERIDDGDTTGA